MKKADQIKLKYLNPFNDFSSIEHYWQKLALTSKHRYFLSWGWISTWIKSLDAETDIRFVVGFFEDKPVLGFIAGFSSKMQYGIFRTKIASLNTTGISYFDELYLEYNQILLDTASLQFHAGDLIEIFLDMPWDVLNLPGLAPEFVEEMGILTLPESSRLQLLVDEQSLASFVDLEQVRAVDLDYLRLISSNKRSQIKRSIKEYEKEGAIEIIEAADVDQALDYFCELIVLHQKEWESRGKLGAFSNKFLLQFHKNLIAARFGYGEIQVLKCNTPKATIGILYNFVYNNDVYFYQSGFNYPPGNIYRPGLVSHCYAILHNARLGRSVYDFMAGDATYKSSLATNSQPVYWVRLFRQSYYYNLEVAIQRVKVRLKSMPEFFNRLQKLKNIFRKRP